MTRTITQLGAFALTLGLASSAIAADIARYYPLQPGNSWSYTTEKHSTIKSGFDVNEATKLGTIEERVVGVSKLSAKGLKLFEISHAVEERGSSIAPVVTAKTTLHVSVTANAVVLLAADVEGRGAVRLPKPVSILQDPPSREPVTSQLGAMKMVTIVKSQAVEAIETPAGKFPKALKKYAEGPITGQLSGLAIHSGTLKEVSWFAPNVGLVRQDRTISLTVRSPEGFETHVEEHSERVLTQYSRGKQAK